MKKLFLLPLIVVSCTASSLAGSLGNLNTDFNELGDTLFENEKYEIRLHERFKELEAIRTNRDLTPEEEAEYNKLQEKLPEILLDNIDDIIDKQLYEAFKNLENDPNEDEGMMNIMEEGIGKSVPKAILQELAKGKNGSITPPIATPYQILETPNSTTTKNDPGRKFNNQTPYEEVQSKINVLKARYNKLSKETPVNQRALNSITQRIRELEETKNSIPATTLPESEKGDLLLGSHLTQILAGEILDETKKLEDEFGEDFLLQIDEDVFRNRATRKSLVKHMSKFKGIKNKLIAYSLFKYDNALKVVKAKRGK